MTSAQPLVRTTGFVRPSRRAARDTRSLGRSGMGRLVALCWIGLIVCAVGLSWSTSLASRAAPGDNTHFDVFWVSLLCFLLPASVALLRRNTRDLDRVLLVIALGLLSMAPKYLAYPGGPAFFDEYAHWTQTERLTEDGLLFQKNNQVVVIGDYPAMHATAASLRHITGLDTYEVSMVMLLAQHVVSLAAVFAIGTMVGKSRHTGGIAALLYAVGPGFWFFNAQFSYEAYAIHLFLWSCVSLVHLHTAGSTARIRTSWLVVGLWISFALVASHHLSSYLNLVVSTSFVAAALFRWILRRESTQHVVEVLLFFAVVAFLTIWWFFTQAPNTSAYYTPYLEGGASEMLSIVESFGAETPEIETTGEDGAREFFKGSTLPIYEQLISFVVPPLAALLAGISFLVQWRRGLARTAAVAMTLVASLYFLVFPLMLSETGAEGARRSWSFTSLGFSVLVAVGMVSIAHLRRRIVRGTLLGIAAVCIALLMVGNVAVGMNEVYRFPGPYIYGSDTRSATSDIFSAAEWFGDTQGPNQTLIGDRTTQVAFASEARATLGVPSAANPIWDYTIGEAVPSDDVLHSTVANELRYVVIDKRQITAIPLIGFYLDQNEPLALEREEPVGEASIAKFDQLDYALRIYSSDNIVIYRFDLGRVTDLVSEETQR